MTGTDDRERERKERALRRSIDDDRTLPGENLDSDLLEDALVWVDVYSELLRFKRSLAETTEETMAEMTPPAREEVSQTDAVVLRAEADRFERRLAHWVRRRDELMGSGAPREPGSAMAAD